MDCSLLVKLIEYRGLLARMLAAQEEASRLIDQVLESLELLGIERTSFSKFVSGQIERLAREGEIICSAEAVPIETNRSQHGFFNWLPS